MYLDEVGVESSQQHSFQKFILVAVLIVKRRLPLALAGTRHQLSLVQIFTELRDETCSKEAQNKHHFVLPVNKYNKERIE